MQTVDDLLKEARQALSKYAYYVRCEVIAQGTRYAKIRLTISRDLFVQINRNEPTSITNLALIHRSQRIYGHDEYRGVWHRHTSSAPEHHNGSPEGSLPISFTNFFREMDELLRAKKLI